MCFDLRASQVCSYVREIKKAICLYEVGAEDVNARSANDLDSQDVLFKIWYRKPRTCLNTFWNKGEYLANIIHCSCLCLHLLFCFHHSIFYSMLYNSHFIIKRYMHFDFQVMTSIHLYLQKYLYCILLYIYCTYIYLHFYYYFIVFNIFTAKTSFHHVLPEFLQSVLQQFCAFK